MKITVTAIPKNIISFFFSPKKIISDKKSCEYLEKMLPFIFGRNTVFYAEKIGVNIFDLIFFGEKPLSECIEKYRSKYTPENIKIIILALILRRLYKGETIKLIDIGGTESSVYIGEPVFLSLSIIDTSLDFSKINKKIYEKYEKNKTEDKGLNKEAEHVYECIRLAAVRFSMRRVLENKELIDKYNFRRFSISLKLNNRPADLDEINRMLVRRKMYTFADLSEAKLRLNFTALYAITNKGLTLEDLYGSDTVFLPDSAEKDKRISEAASELINIISNGNGIEIANMFVSMIFKMAEVKVPKVNVWNLSEVMSNYSVFYAVASLAATCESIFTFNDELKRYMRKRLIDSYWKYMKRLISLKRFSSVVILCHKLAELDLEQYRNSPSYRKEIMYAFEKADNFIKEFEKGNDWL